MTRFVVGNDAGATTTRCALADASGRVLGRGPAPGANLNSSAAAQSALSTALAAAVGTTRTVNALVLGVAGAGPAGQPRAEQLMRIVLDRAGLRVGAPIVHSDVEVAFAAGSAEPDGAVLIAGTGAVAARIEGFDVVRRVDGHGYRLGDRGSAGWIGTAALQAALAAIEGTGAPTCEQCAVDGDAVATSILDDAVAALVATARAVAGPGAFVVTGAVAAGDGWVGTRLRAALTDCFDSAPVVVENGLPVAVALAIRALAATGADAAGGSR